MFGVISTNLIGDFILKNIPEPTFCHGYFVSTRALGRKLKNADSVINCASMLPSDIQDIADDYRELILGNRIQQINGVELDLDDKYVREAINILLFAFSARLAGEKLANYKPYGTKLTMQDWEFISNRIPGTEIGHIRTFF